MSTAINKCIVARFLSSGETYYLSNYPGGVTLDNEVYEPYIADVGNIPKFGNFDGGNQIGTCSVALIHGETNFQGSYIFDTTRVWSKRKVILRLCDVDNDTSWSDCEALHSGIIQNFKIGHDQITLDVDDRNQKDDILVPSYTVEDYVALEDDIDEEDIPDKFAGKRVPIVVGDLTDRDSGEFAKCITISDRIGFQKIILDRKNLNRLDGVGMWENGLGRFFMGRSIIPVNEKRVEQFTLSPNNSAIQMISSAITSLAADTATDTEGIEVITVSNWGKINWIDETEDSIKDELLSQNIIAIDSELMLIVEKPSSNSIYVERGYGGTTIVNHTSGALIYETSTYSSKQLITFLERFDAVSISNFTVVTDETKGRITFEDWNTDPISHVNNMVRVEVSGAGKLSNFVDGNTSSYLRVWAKIDVGGIASSFNLGQVSLFADLKFPAIETDFGIINAFHGFKYRMQITPSQTWYNNAIGYGRTAFIVFDPDVASAIMPDGSNIDLRFISDGVTAVDWSDGPRSVHNYLDSSSSDQNPDTGVIDLFSSFGVDQNKSAHFYSTGAEWGAYLSSGTEEITSLSNLRDLNKKWKFCITSFLYVLSAFGNPNNNQAAEYDSLLYNYGLWIELYTNYLKEMLLAPAIGREVTAKIAYVTGSTSNTAISNPIDAIVMLLLDEMGYEYGDFESASTITTYYGTDAHFDGTDNAPAASAAPTIAFSYGVDETEKGWDLCSKIASHYMLALVKKNNGDIRIINLHQLQNKDNTSGYPSLTAYAIPFDSILVPGTEKLFDLQQTGTDMLRNDILIRYSRNNSTGAYQKSYPTADDSPDSYTLLESGLTLGEARNAYYGGEKTEQLIIESPFIYDDNTAEILWKWHINDKAEAHFWASFTVDYEHYDTVNGKSSQYQRGDIIYFSGKYSGITFDNSYLFSIVNISINDSGREIEIQAKSIEPISSFSSDALGQNDTYQNDPTETDIWKQDPTEATNIYQNKT